MSEQQTGETNISLQDGVSRLVSDEVYAHGVQQNFSQHVETHSKLDALARCRALNAFLAENVRSCSSASGARACCAIGSAAGPHAF